MTTETDTHLVVSEKIKSKNINLALPEKETCAIGGG